MTLRAAPKARKSPPKAETIEEKEHLEIPGIAWLTPHEAWQDYDAYVRKRMGISTEEFEFRWDRGDFSDEFDFPEAIYVSMMRCERPRHADESTPG